MKEALLWSALTAFIAFWTAFAFVAKRNGWSKTIGIGGGFLVSSLLFSAVGTLFMKVSEPPLPESLAKAGLQNKHWNDSELNLAAKITKKNLRDIQVVLADADRRGDSASAVRLFDNVTPIMAAWNDQDIKKLGGYYNCALATMHLADGVQSVYQGGVFQSGRFEAAIEACGKAVK